MFKNRRRRSRVKDVQLMAKLFPAADAVALSDGVHDTRAEHLLIAALELDESGHRAFARVGANANDFGAAVSDQHAEALRGTGLQDFDNALPETDKPEPPILNSSSPSAKKMFRAVVDKVRHEKSQLYSAYFVLVAAELERGTVPRAIRHMGIEPTALADSAREEIALLNG